MLHYTTAVCKTQLFTVKCILTSVLPEGSSREVTVGAAGGRAGAGVVQHGDQGVGRVSNHVLKVKAVLGEGRDGERALPAGP